MVFSLKFFGSSDENYWLSAIKSNVYTLYYSCQKYKKQKPECIGTTMMRSQKKINDLDMFFIRISRKRHSGLLLFRRYLWQTKPIQCWNMIWVSLQNISKPVLNIEQNVCCICFKMYFLLFARFNQCLTYVQLLCLEDATVKDIFKNELYSFYVFVFNF